MFDPIVNRHRFPRSAALSLGAHALLGAVLFLSLKTHPVHVFTLPGTAQGTRVEIAYLPGRAPAPPLQPKKVKPRPTTVRDLTPAAPTAAAIPAPSTLIPPPTPHLSVTEAAPAPANQSPPSAVPDSASGSDSWGDGSIQIALTTFSPSPKPDLSLLPRGVQGDVIVDVTIDPTGKVADLAVLRTLGYGIESSVIGTLKTWQFRPATKAGVPIASVQELHFHFGPV